MSEDDRKLDALVAEKLMGYSERADVRTSAKDAWRVAFRKGPTPSYEYHRYFTEDGTKLYCGQPYAPHFPPRYSASLSAAWLVAEEMRRRGRVMSMHAVPNSENWCVAFGPDSERLDASAPRAIVFAALAALGVEVQP